MSRGLFYMVTVKIPGLKYEFYRVVDGETRREIKINAISHFKYTAESGEGWTQYSGPTFAISNFTPGIQPDTRFK